MVCELLTCRCSTDLAYRRPRCLEVAVNSGQRNQLESRKMRRMKWLKGKQETKTHVHLIRHQVVETAFKSQNAGIKDRNSHEKK
jgi:hypothetical protein